MFLHPEHAELRPGPGGFGDPAAAGGFPGQQRGPNREPFFDLLNVTFLLRQRPFRERLVRLYFNDRNNLYVRFSRQQDPLSRRRQRKRIFDLQTAQSAIADLTTIVTQRWSTTWV
jgi:hypothetical protein